MGGDAPPIVSIITPTFDHRDWIAACIASVIAQTDPRWEQIVVDDGSTDGTGDVVRGFADPRIHYVSRPHGGIERLAEAYNEALGMARGDLVAVLEGDDFWPPDKLERQLPSLADPAIVLSWGRAGETDAAGRVRRTVPARAAIARARGEHGRGATLRSLLRNNDIPACTVICRRQPLLAVGGFRQPDGLPNVDYPTWLELSRVGAFAAVPAVLGYWRRHDSQVTTSMSTEMLRNVSWGRMFVDRLPPDERHRLGVSSAEARRIERESRAALAVVAARAAARRGRRRSAATGFRRALRTGAAPTRARALLGLVSLRLGIDLDGLLRRHRCHRHDREIPSP